MLHAVCVSVYILAYVYICVCVCLCMSHFSCSVCDVCTRMSVFSSMFVFTPMWMLLWSILFMFVFRWNKCLLSAKCCCWANESFVFRTGKVFSYVCSGVCVSSGFVRVGPVKAAPYRAVSAAVLCVSVLADDTVSLLWSFCRTCSAGADRRTD